MINYSLDKFKSVSTNTICPTGVTLVMSSFRKHWRYRKIPKISPGAYIFQMAFLRGLFLEGLIFEGAYVRRKICVSKSIGPKYKPPGDLYLEGRFKVVRHSFSGPIPPKFEHKLRRHKQSFGKIAITVVLDEDENLSWSVLQWRYFLFCLQQYISALGTVLPKSFTGAFSSNSGLDVREV